MGSTQSLRRCHRLRTIRTPRNTSRLGREKTTRTCRPWPRCSNTMETPNRHRMLRACLAALISLAVLGNAAPTQAQPKDNHSVYGGIMVDQYYTQLSICETNGDVNHSTRSYTGMFGIHRMSFKRWSNYTSAKGLTPRQQVKVADAIAFTGFTQRNGEHIWRVGPFGWGAVRNGCGKMLDMICKSKHLKVLRYGPRACRLVYG